MRVGSSGSFYRELGQQTFSMRLEKHFNDVVRGMGDYSRSVPAELHSRSFNASAALAASDPKALVMMSGYQTMLRYDRAARMMNNVSYGVEQMSALLRRVV